MKIEKHPIKDRASWLAMRKPDLTASNIAAVCGCSPWQSAMEIWCQKAGLIPEPKETDIMRTGRLLEPAVLAWLMEEHPDWTLAPAGIYLRAPEHRLGATPDAIAYDAKHRLVNVQIKTCGRRQFDEWNGVVPIGYQLQVCCEAMLLGADYSLLAGMTREFSPQFFEFRIDRNAGAERRVLEMAGDFWKSITEGRTPQADFKRDANLIAKLKPPRQEQVDALDFDNDNRLADVLGEHESLQAEEKTVKQRIEELRAEILDKLNGASAARCGEWMIRHRIQQRNIKAREAHVQSFAQLTISRESRP